MASEYGSVVRERVRATVERTWRAATADDLLHHGGIVAAATVISGGLNYAFQLFMGRALPPEEYGVFGALFALFYLVNVLGRGMRFSAARFVAEFDRPAATAGFLRGALLRSLLIGGVIFAVLAATSGAVGDFLGVDPHVVVVVAVTVPPGLALTVTEGTLDGRQQFLALGAVQILKAASKLVLALALVLAGFGVAGAFGAVAVALGLTLAVAAVALFRRLGPVDRTVPSFDYARAYRYSGPAVLAGFCLAVPANADVIVVKHAFPATEAGMYTAASVLGKVLIFLPMGISTALFPKVSADHASEGTDRQGSLLSRGLAYAAAVGGAGALVYWVAPKAILTLFFGEAYAAAAPLLRWYGLAIVPFVLAVVVLNYQLARDRTAYVYAFAVGSVAEIGLLWTAQSSMLRVVRLLTLANVVLFAVGLLAVHFEQ
ncbi:lipopolysaccharide biosynthesis protein [Halosimplex amylolyticum]|uniref:lipopolysaccharide biosynthesis protein n=1 Tax=Halosimplex amylolyticum TaxID=3396616 RepID=UPI003F55D996